MTLPRWLARIAVKEPAPRPAPGRIEWSADPAVAYRLRVAGASGVVVVLVKGKG